MLRKKGKNSEHANENRSESVLRKQKQENDKNQRKKERKTSCVQNLNQFFVSFMCGAMKRTRRKLRTLVI